jgi:hypothetical protein
MGKGIVFGGVLGVLVACGGGVDATGESATDTLPAAPRDGEQGLYQPAKPAGPDHMADDVGSPSALAMTIDRVMFTTHRTRVAGEVVEAGGVFVVDKRVGAAQLLGLDRQGASYDALAVDGTTAFVATSDGRLVSVPVAGGTMVTVAKLDAPAVALTVSVGYMYFATGAGVLARVATKGGAVEPLATITGDVRGLEADDDAVYVTTGAAEETPAGIVRVALDGSAVKVLASGNEPCAMVRDGRRLFWTSLAVEPGKPSAPAATGEVRRLSLDGGDVATVASGSFRACAIAADRESLFFATTVPSALPVKAGGSTAGSVGLGLMRAPIGGGEPVAIAQASHALAQPGAVAVDATHLYWLTPSSVLRLKK